MPREADRRDVAFVLSGTVCFVKSWAGGVAGVEVGDRVSEVERRDSGDGACEEEAEAVPEPEPEAVAVAGDDVLPLGVRPLPALGAPLPTPAEVLLQALFQTWGLVLPVGLVPLVLLTPLAAVDATVVALLGGGRVVCSCDLSF